MPNAGEGMGLGRAGGIGRGEGGHGGGGDRWVWFLPMKIVRGLQFETFSAKGNLVERVCLNDHFVAFCVVH